MKAASIFAVALATTGLCAGSALAQETFKVGVSVGLTGYAAAVDRAWRDGLEVAADYVNSKGGVRGRKIQLVIEDNKSEPQEAVTVYRKMISSDKVNIFISGCVSAGNFAAAQFVVRAQIPMMLCSILPPQPDLAVFKPTGETLGNQFLFVAAPAQVYENLPEGALKQEIARFLPLWRAKHGDRDAVWAGKAWDALMVTIAAIEKAQSFDGEAIRAAVETLPPYQGTGGLYSFSPSVHQGITTNPFFMATYENGKVQVKE